MLDLTLAAAQRHDLLTIFPLVAVGEPELPYALLVDALAAGTVRITEVGTGTVPELLATNKAETDVLVLDGEQLVGARQNRMTNRSILLPARSETCIPVSCMEQGRWHFASDAMQPAPQHSPSKVRRKARTMEAEYAAAGMPAPASSLAHAQSGVWAEIAGIADALEVPSPTGALNDVYDAARPALEAATSSFPLVPGQVGLLAFQRGSPLGMDLIGGRALYARVHARLLRGYVLDALDARARARRRGAASGETAQAAAAPDASEALRFLARVRAAQRVDTPTVGRGEYRVLTGDVIGAELEADGAPVHLSAFPTDERSRRPDMGPVLHEEPASPVAPPSVRRRRRGG